MSFFEILGKCPSFHGNGNYVSDYVSDNFSARL